MTILLGILGLLVLILASIDLLWTTFVEGVGPMSLRVALLVGKLLRYSVLHFFHSSKRSAGVGANIAILDEAITIMECGLEKGCSLDLPSLGAVREAISEYIVTLKPVLMLVYDDGDPPVPSLAPLREIGLPVVDDATFTKALEGQTERRCLLRKLARIEGWTWDAVWPKNIDLTRGI